MWICRRALLVQLATVGVLTGAKGFQIASHLMALPSPSSVPQLKLNGYILTHKRVPFQIGLVKGTSHGDFGVQARLCPLVSTVASAKANFQAPDAGAAAESPVAQDQSSWRR